MNHLAALHSAAAAQIKATNPALSDQAAAERAAAYVWMKLTSERPELAARIAATITN